MSFMLDTNTVSDLVRNPQGKVARRISLAGRQNVRISIIVACELRFGVEDRYSPKRYARIEELLDSIRIEPLDRPAHMTYGTIRAILKETGQQIGANDLFIAAHALALDHTLVTDNEREFLRVPGLKVENWLT